ncbi:MAG: hypothetical protein CM15mP32_4110 [Flavobacteriaceae bacterium]|nr:MAG: hypothetical protein CM15mP32_4110 [Flavobacteriaceae bacterium]
MTKCGCNLYGAKVGARPKEFALIETEPGVTFNVPITALGGSVATPSVGLKAEVVEGQNFEELQLWEEKNRW